MLVANSPEQIWREPKRNFIDWRLRDGVTRKEIAAAIRSILGSPGRPRRLTMRSIGSEVGSSGSLRTSLQYMPRSRALIERMVDTDYSFMLRRLQFAAALFVEGRSEEHTSELAKRSGFDFSVVRDR